MKDRYILEIEQDGEKMYYKNDEYHREDGPAIIVVSYTRYAIDTLYYLNGELLEWFYNYQGQRIRI